MNKERRKSLEGAILELNQAKEKLEAIDFSDITDLLDSAKSVVEEVGSDEQESFDNMTEGLQKSERGQRMEEVAGSLDEANSDISNLSSSIQEAVKSWLESIDEDVGKIEECMD